MTRVRALVVKEFLDLRRNRAALVPVAAVTLVSLVLPLLIVVLVPAATHQPLGLDRELTRLSAAIGTHPELTADGVVQLFLLQQFLFLFLLTPITGAMSLASHAIVGEKQARTLEPLLATPVTTVELLVAKVLGSLAPTLAISLVGLVIYFVGIAVLAAPGVAAAMASLRTLVLVVLVGPAAALVSLQFAIVISSRVNDARTAQQFGVLIILPLTGLVVAQFAGLFWVSSAILALVGLGMLGLWVLLTVVSAALFEREAILTRWR